MTTANQKSNKVWQDEYTIHSYEVDAKGRATLPILCQFMQESAWNHAEHLGLGFDHLFEQNSVWVIARQCMQIQRFPKWGETIYVQTWPTGKDRILRYRDFKILDAQNRVIGKTTSAWLVIDIHTRKPKRSSSYFHIDAGEYEQVLPGKLRTRLDVPQNIEFTKSLEVTYKDLDFHEHVNNVRYIEWILDGFTLEFRKEHTLQEAEIHYLAEALYHDTLTVNFEKHEDFSYAHNIVREHDLKELCKARTLWQPNGEQQAK